MADVTGPGIRFPIIADAADAVKGVDKFLVKLKGVGERAKVAGKAMAVMGAAITAAFAMGMKKAVEFGTSIDRMAEATGIAHEKISKLAFAVGQYHGSQEALQKSMKRLAYAMAETKDGAAEYKDEFDKLGITVTDNTGKLRSIDSVFYELSDKLAGMGDNTQALATAQKILGRSGEGLLPILKKGGDALREQGEMAEKLGLVLNAKTAKALETLGTTVGNIKKAVLGFTTTALRPLIEGVTNFAQKIVDLTAKMIAWMKEHPKATGLLVKLTGTVGVLTTAIGGTILVLLKLVPAIKAVAVALHTPPLGLIVIIASAITLLITFRKEVWNASKKTYDYVRAFGAKIAEYVVAVVDKILGVFQKLPLMGEKIAAARGKLEKAVEKLEDFKDGALEAGRGIKVFGEKAAGATEKAGEGLDGLKARIDGVAEAAGEMPEALAQSAEKAVDRVKNAVAELNRLTESQRLERFGGAVGAKITYLAETLTGQMHGVTEWAARLARKAQERVPGIRAGLQREQVAEILGDIGAPTEAQRKQAEYMARARVARISPSALQTRAIQEMIAEAPIIGGRGLADVRTQLESMGLMFERLRGLQDIQGRMTREATFLGRPPGGALENATIQQTINAIFKDVDLKEIADKVAKLVADGMREAVAMVGD